MRRDMRVAVWLSLCVVAAFAWAASAVASGSLPEGLGESVGGVAAGPRMSLESPFVRGAVPTPEQLRGDVVSRTAFERLGRDAAVSLAEGDFGIARPSWVPPAAEGKGRLVKYLAQNAAAEELPGGGHAVLASTIPLRVDDGSGLAPVSLTLHDDGEAYVPVNPLVPVAISTRAGGGIAFPDGLSVAPVAAAATEAPTVVGNRVVFANFAPDSDLIEEPEPQGAAISWQLRSQNSPADQALAFRLPPGGALRESATRPGAVEVLVGGKPTLLVRPAVAQDADGAPVPVSYTISGNVLTTHVDLSGNVAFPVLVDPGVTNFEADYGEYAGEGSWADWGTSMGSGWGLIDEPAKLGTSASPGVPLGSVAEFYVEVPGPQGKPGSAGISRVNLEGLTHSTEESKVQASITGDTATEPAYSFVPTEQKATKLGTMDYVGDLSGALAAFCARWTGESDSEPEGLCDEKYDQGSRFYIAAISEGNPTKASQFLWFDEAVFIYREPEPSNKPVLNHLGYYGQWLKTAPSNFTIEAEDEGLGIAKLQLDAPGPVFTEENSCAAHGGFAGCPSQRTSVPINLAPVEESGELTLTPAATSPGLWVMPGSGVRLYLDKSAPVINEFTGSLGQAANHVIGDGNYTLGFSAVDGSSENAKTVRSGVQSIEIKVDGKTVDHDGSSCAQPIERPLPWCYELSGTWTMNGQTYGAGVHTITVVAKNWVGTTSEKSFNVTVNEAAYEPVGPGAVNLETGDFKLNPTDVSISGGNASLTVSRTYDSRNLTQGATGPLGPQWVLSLPDSAAAGEWQSLNPLTNGSVALSTANGEQVTFTPKEGGGYNSPAGYQNETLTEPSHNPAEYELTDPQSDYTRFTQPSSGTPFVPSKVAQTTTAGVGGLNKVTYSFTTKEGITEPTEVLAPEPSEGACTAKLVQGCRALTFTYATSTTATGEAEKEWGEYKGRLSKVYFTAWESAKGEMSPPIAVAQYAFDSKGHLRAEWDPRLAKPLVTTDGYDSEGHVTAVSPPGQEPWLLHYGTIPSDSNAGRLLSVGRFNAETALWNGKILKNSKAPKLSTSAPVLGTALSSTAGTWNEPVAYGYQWERCSYAGGECAPILGATNESYTPIVADVGHALRVQVTGTGSAGSVAITSEVSGPVNAPLGSPFSFASRGEGAGQTVGPEAVAIAPSGNVWIADTEDSRLEEFSASGSFIEALGWGVANGESKLQTCSTKCQSGLAGLELGEFYRPDGIAINQSNGYMYVSDWKSNRVQEFSAAGEFMRELEPESGHPGMGEPEGIALDAAGNVWVASKVGCNVWELNPEGALKARYGECGKEALGKFEQISGVALSGEALYATDSAIARVQELLGGKWVREFGASGKGKVGNASEGASGVAADGFSGDVAASNPYRGTVDVFSTEGKFVEELGGSGKGTGEIEGPLGLAANPKTGAIYVADYGNYRIDAWTPASGPTQEPTQPPPSPGTTSVTTIDYQVPVSGAGAPYALGSKEVGEWAQKDVPQEATAIFPASEPQGWPATEYKHAELFYLDSANRTVNTVSPSGGISTTEFNEANDNVEHTLNPDNRLAALKQGSQSAQTAKLLQTESTYNPEGTALTSTLGPQHQIKLVSGSEVSARKHTQYFYEENAPSGGPYHLLTKIIEGAQISGGGEEEKRTVKTFYNGQENLGWKLHAPTSTETTSSSGHTIEGRTTYEASTGNVTSTTTPAGKTNRTPQYNSEWGKYGSEAGQMIYPAGIAVDTTASEDVWVADSGNSRIDEYSPSGAFIETFGWGVGGEKGVLQTCKSSCKAGSPGSGTGQLNSPMGVAYNPANGDIYVSDTFNNRIEVYTTAGVYVRTFGESGSGEGKLNSPQGLTAESNGNILVADEENNRVEEFNSEGKYITSLSHQGYDAPSGVTVCNGKIYATGAAQHLVGEFETSGTYVGSFNIGEATSTYSIACDPINNELYVTTSAPSQAEIYSGSGEFIGAFGTHGSGAGQFEIPHGVAINKAGAAYVVDYFLYRVEKWTPGNTGAHTTETIYYTAGANATFPNCGKHPEWAGLACLGRHAAQPEASGIYNLPETSYTYNIWNEPLSTKDIVISGAEKIERTSTATYDAAGRPEKSAISAPIDKTVPTVTDAYNTETGMLDKQSIETESKVIRSISDEFNKLGQMTAYTDAAETTTTLEYEKEKEFRLLKISDSKGSQTFGYEVTTGLLASVKDSGAGTFTATHDVEGNLTSEGYPNGMNAEYTYNPVDEPVSLEYVKTTHCTSGCLWYYDRVAPSIHGQWLTQSSSLSKESYAHDELGRLTEAQETPAGKGCTARLYTDDEDGNRMSVTTRESSSEKCPTEGGTSQDNSYDTGDQLDEAGVNYEPFGNITSLPAADAGGSPLTSTFYVNDRLASQEQNGEKLSYNLDPDNRPLETLATGKTESTVTSHYDGPGQTPAWTATSTGSYTRNITGINGALAAIQTNSEAPVLQLADLHGDIVGTAAISETESKFVPANETNEYGVPRTSVTAKYSWLGSDLLATELPTGIISMGARTYIPQLGRFLQTDPQPGGSANAYAYTGGDPVDESDPSGEYTTTTYNYSAAESSAAPEGPPQAYIAPGALIPPEVNLQLEAAANAHPPWDAVRVARALEDGTYGSREAVAAFDHTWTVSPGVAFALGTAITASGTNIGSTVLGFVDIPGWLIQGIDAVGFRGRLKAFASDLLTAGANAAPDSEVEINLFGSLRYGLHSLITYEEEDE